MEKLNSIKQQIINRISPYMNKNLSIGCYYSDIYSNLDKIDEGVNIDSLIGNIDKGSAEIIGHYDLSAVFKFLEDHRYSLLQHGNKEYSNPKYNIKLYKNVWYIEDNGKEMGDFINSVEFNLDPLHLYSDIDDKNLNKLLSIIEKNKE